MTFGGCQEWVSAFRSTSDGMSECWWPAEACLLLFLNCLESLSDATCTCGCFPLCLDNFFAMLEHDADILVTCFATLEILYALLLLGLFWDFNCLSALFIFILLSRAAVQNYSLRPII